MAEHTHWVFDTFRLEPATGSLCHDDQPLKLPPRAFAVLCYLVEHAGKLIAKDELLDAVWQHRFVSESVLKGCINEVRRALGDDAKSPLYIETHPRRGYRFKATVQRIEAPSATRASALDLVRALGDRSRVKMTADHLLERSTLLDQMRARLDVVLNGSRQFLFVTGEAGIGKTTLVDNFLDSLSNQGIGTLEGRCIENYGSGEPFLPLLESLERICRKAGGAELISRMQRWAPTWLAQMPGLLAPDVYSALQQSVLGATGNRMLREFVSLIESLAQEIPLVLVIEDLHWSDASTLDALALLAQRSDPALLLVIGTFRPEDASFAEHPVKRLFQGLFARQSCTHLALVPFSRDEISAYLSHCLGGEVPPEPLIDLVHQRTEGHPLFVENVIEDWFVRGILSPDVAEWQSSKASLEQFTEVPERLRVLINQRIDTLTPLDRRVLTSAAAAGETWPVPLIASAAELDIVSVEQCCEVLTQQGQMIASTDVVVWPSATPSPCFRFLHALYREVFYARLSTVQRRRTHQRIAACLVAAYGDETIRVAGQIAEHYERGGDYFHAVLYLQQAAQNATKRFANREALAYLGRALTLLDRLPEADRIGIQVTLLRQRVSVRSAMDDLGGAVDDLTAIQTLAQKVNEPAVEVAALVEISRIARWLDVDMCMHAAEQAKSLSRSLKEDRVRLLAEVNQAMASLRFVQWNDQCVAFSRAAFAKLRGLNDPQLLNSMYFSYAWMEILASNYDLATAIAKEGMESAKRLNDAYYMMSSQWFLGWALIHRGDLGTALGHLTAALRLAERNESGFAIMGFCVALARLHEELLDFGRTRALAERALSVMGREQGHLLSHLAQLMRGRALLGMQKYDDAVACFDAVLTAVDRVSEFTDWQVCLPLYEGLSRYHLARGNLKLAGRMAQQLVAVATVPPERTYLGLAHGLQADIAIANQGWDHAQQELDLALAAIGDGPVPDALRQAYGIAAVPVDGPVSGSRFPLAAWRIYATAVALAKGRGQRSIAREYADKLRNSVATLTATLDPADPLRRTFRQKAATLC